MLRLYSYAYAVTEASTGRSIVGPGACLANNDFEATGMALAGANKRYPSPEYVHHQAWVMTVRQNFIDQVCSHTPEA